MKEMAVKKALRDSISREARAFVERNFSAQRMAKEYESLYQSLLPSTVHR